MPYCTSYSGNRSHFSEAPHERLHKAEAEKAEAEKPTLSAEIAKAKAEVEEAKRKLTETTAVQNQLECMGSQLGEPVMCDSNCSTTKQPTTSQYLEFYMSACQEKIVRRNYDGVGDVVFATVGSVTSTARGKKHHDSTIANYHLKTL